jgi:dUTP pyrophosphatase
MSYFNVELCCEDARVPFRGTANAAGYDLYTPCDFTLSPQQTVLIKLGIKVEIPEGFYGRIAPRSSYGVKGIDVFAGVVDSDYRDEVGVVLYNSTNKMFAVNKGDRIAQMIIEKHYSPEITVVKSLSQSDREGGFGSTDDHRKALLTGNYGC